MRKRQDENWYSKRWNKNKGVSYWEKIQQGSDKSHGKSLPWSLKLFQKTNYWFYHIVKQGQSLFYELTKKKRKEKKLIREEKSKWRVWLERGKNEEK